MTYDDILMAWSGPQNGLGDIYWIDSRIIEELQQKHIKQQVKLRSLATVYLEIHEEDLIHSVTTRRDLLAPPSWLENLWWTAQ